MHGKISRAYLGIDGVTATPALAVLYHAPRSSGVYVEWVDPEGPAAAAGLRWGDVIFAIGDVPVEQLGDLSNALTYRFRPGETVEIQFARGSSEQVARVTLGATAAPYGGPV